MEEPFVKNKSRARRRRNSISKALRKKRLHMSAYGCDMYDNLHQFSKNKIHQTIPKAEDFYHGCRFKPAPPLKERRKLIEANDRIRMFNLGLE